VLVARQGSAVARAQLAQAQRLYDYTKVSAPKASRIGRRLVDRGALVKADETVLATLVVTDPMHVYFDVDDRTNIRLNQLVADGKLKLDADSTTTVQIGLPTQEGFPPPKDGGFTGQVTFRDTQLTATTGTITLRADVPNPKGILTPNLFVRVRLPLGDPRPRVLVPEECIFTDQGLKHVWVVNAKDEAEYRLVQVGLQVGTEVVVEPVPGKANSGVAEGERVIVEGGQRVRKDVKVTVR
jgi:RND family efflux transporter MFP subunit